MTVGDSLFEGISSSRWRPLFSTLQRESFLSRRAMASLVGSPWIRISVRPDLPLSFLRPCLVSKPYLSVRRRSLSVSAFSATGPADGEVRVRFAPSPTGNLHVGGARTALFNYLFARFISFSPSQSPVLENLRFRYVSCFLLVVWKKKEHLFIFLGKVAIL